MTNTKEQQTSPKNKQPKLCSIQETWEQENDCCDEGDLGQFLEISTHDGGGGNYLVIKTDRWAIDGEDIDSLVKMLKNVLKKVEKSSTLS